MVFISHPPVTVTKLSQQADVVQSLKVETGKTYVFSACVHPYTIMHITFPNPIANVPGDIFWEIVCRNGNINFLFIIYDVVVILELEQYN